MNNKIAKTIKIVSIITLLLSIAISIYAVNEGLHYAMDLFSIGIAGIISSFFIRAFAEVIELLQSIKDNTSSKTTSTVLYANNKQSQSEEEKKDNSFSSGWKCVCGRENAHYVSSCACGRNRRDGEVKP